jgi:hypothetical protein
MPIRKKGKPDRPADPAGADSYAARVRGTGSNDGPPKNPEGAAIVALQRAVDRLTGMVIRIAERLSSIERSTQDLLTSDGVLIGGPTEDGGLPEATASSSGFDYQAALEEESKRQLQQQQPKNYKRASNWADEPVEDCVPDSEAAFLSFTSSSTNTTSSKKAGPQ